MLEDKKNWNDTQWEIFCQWHDESKDKAVMDESLIKEKIKAMMDVNKKASKISENQVIIFGVIYAFIAGWAITNAVLTFSTIMSKDYAEIQIHHDFLSYSGDLLIGHLTPIQYQNLLVFLSFFPLAIIFYHSGAIFLSSKAASLITGGDRGRTLANFFIILLDGIILYLMSDRVATSGTVSNSVIISSAGPYVSLVILLMVISIAWVVLFRYLDYRDKKQDYPIYMEWLHFDLFILIFCIIFINSGAIVEIIPNCTDPDIMKQFHLTNADCKDPNTLTNTDMIPYLCMFLVFVTMTICNYKFAWHKMWKIFQATD